MVHFQVLNHIFMILKTTHHISWIIPIIVPFKLFIVNGLLEYFFLFAFWKFDFINPPHILIIFIIVLVFQLCGIDIYHTVLLLFIYSNLFSFFFIFKSLNQLFNFVLLFKIFLFIHLFSFSLDSFFFLLVPLAGLYPTQFLNF